MPAYAQATEDASQTSEGEIKPSNDWTIGISLVRKRHIIGFSNDDYSRELYFRPNNPFILKGTQRYARHGITIEGDEQDLDLGLSE